MKINLESNLRDNYAENFKEDLIRELSMQFNSKLAKHKEIIEMNLNEKYHDYIEDLVTKIRELKKDNKDQINQIKSYEAIAIDLDNNLKENSKIISKMKNDSNELKKEIKNMNGWLSTPEKYHLF